MVDVVDLLEDSTDDEAGQTTSRDKFVTTASGNCSATPSSWLRDVVSNGYETKQTAPIAAASSKTSEIKPCTASAGHETSKVNDSSDDEVLWIPPPATMVTKVNQNAATTPTTCAPMASATVASSTKKCLSKSTGNLGGDDDDVEVLTVFPPKLKSSSNSVTSTAVVPQLSLSEISNRTLTATTKISKLSRRSVIDSDNDDDDFLQQIPPSGLVQHPPNLPKLSKSQNYDQTIEPWRRQFQHIANTTNIQRSSVSTTNSSAVSTSTPLSSTNSTILKSQSSSEPSSSIRKWPLYNPYAKAKTSSLPSQTSTDGLFLSSSSSSGVDFRSPLTAKGQSTVVTNPYGKTKNSGRKRSRNNTALATTMALACGVCVPKLRDKSKQYPDLRPNILLALWKFARSKLVRDSYQGRRLDQFIGRIVDLAVTAHDFPIRSMGEYGVRKRSHLSKRGCGGVAVPGDTLKRFEEELNSTKMMDAKLSPVPGKYFSISEACLVAMKEIIVRRWKNKRQQQQQSHSQAAAARMTLTFPVDAACQIALFSQKDFYVSLVELIPQIDWRLHPKCPSTLERRGEADRGAAYYLSKATRSAEFKQIEKLLAPVEIPKPDGSIETTSYIKRRSVGGKVHYQLTPLGFQKAVVISKRSLPTVDGHYRSSNLLKVPDKYESICLGVDFREGGAGDRYRKVLHQMCNKLDLQMIPYFVATLRIGDYVFFSGEKLLPILVERKSVEDVAKSIDIGDGRWGKQKQRMYQGQFVFGYQNCRIAYIIEGNVEKELVSNSYIANARHKVSKERFEEEVANLEEEGFEVLRTCSVENSMFELCRLAESVAGEVQNGKLPLKFTYDEFVKEVDKIPKETDFSRLAKDYARERKRRGEEVGKESSTVDLISDEESNDWHEKDLCPIILDKRLQATERRPTVDRSDCRPNTARGAQKRFRLNEVSKLKASGRRFEDAMYLNAASLMCDAKTTAFPISVDAVGLNATKNEYIKWMTSALREKCVELGMKKTGSKAELIERLLDVTNHPPPVYRLRQQRGLYVPSKIDTASTAILVAIQIQQDGAPVGVEQFGGSTKDDIYVMANKIDIKKDPFCGGTTQTGPYRE